MLTFNVGIVALYIRARRLRLRDNSKLILEDSLNLLENQPKSDLRVGFITKKIFVGIVAYDLNPLILKNLEVLTNILSQVDIWVIDDSGSGANKNYIENNFSVSNLSFILNDKNLGYTASANILLKKALESNNYDFVMLVNDDVLISRNTIQKLHRTLKYNKKLASVTPLSNKNKHEIGLAILNCINIKDQVEHIDKFLELSAATSKMPYLEIPFNQGFAVLYSVKALKKVGLFNESTYRIGYGEEIDWSLRASKLGFRNVLALNTFAYHASGESFSYKSEVLIKRAEAKLINDYPILSRLRKQVLDVFQSLEELNFLISINTARKSNLKIFVFISHGLGGGATNYEKNRITELFDKEYYDFGIKVQVGDSTKQKISIVVNKKILSTLDIEFNLVLNLIALLNPNLLILGATSGTVMRKFLSMSDLENLERVIKQEKINTELIIHDYYSICPSYTLINDFYDFCGVPKDVNVCETCITNNDLASIPSGFTNIEDWRKLFSNLFNLTTLKVICWSEDSLKWLERAYGESIKNKVEIRDPWKTHKYGYDKKANKLKIASVGNLTYAKGLSVVNYLSKSIEKLGLNIELHHFGGPQDGLSGRIIKHGSYNSETVISSLRKEHLDLILIPSIWPETYCQVVEETEPTGLPMLVPKNSAIYVRKRNLEQYTFFTSVQDILQHLQELTVKK